MQEEKQQPSSQGMAVVLASSIQGLEQHNNPQSDEQQAVMPVMSQSLENPQSEEESKGNPPLIEKTKTPRQLFLEVNLRLQTLYSHYARWLILSQHTALKELIHVYLVPKIDEDVNREDYFTGYSVDELKQRLLNCFQSLQTIDQNEASSIDAKRKEVQGYGLGSWVKWGFKGGVNLAKQAVTGAVSTSELTVAESVAALLEEVKATKILEQSSQQERSEGGQEDCLLPNFDLRMFGTVESPFSKFLAVLPNEKTIDGLNLTEVDDEKLSEATQTILSVQGRCQKVLGRIEVEQSRRSTSSTSSVSNRAATYSLLPASTTPLLTAPPQKITSPVNVEQKLEFLKGKIGEANANKLTEAFGEDLVAILVTLRERYDSIDDKLEDCKEIVVGVLEKEKLFLKFFMEEIVVHHRDSRLVNLNEPLATMKSIIEHSLCQKKYIDLLDEQVVFSKTVLAVKGVSLAEFLESMKCEVLLLPNKLIGVDDFSKSLTELLEAKTGGHAFFKLTANTVSEFVELNRDDALYFKNDNLSV